jgi:hypothetical protein
MSHSSLSWPSQLFFNLDNGTPPHEEGAEETTPRLGGNERLGAGDKQPKSLEADNMGPAKAMGRAGSPDEFCTFDLQHWRESTLLALRFPTSNKVQEIRTLLQDRLKEMGWLSASPFLMHPSSGDMLPCLFSASQVMALAYGPDPTSTPVDTLLHFQMLPPSWSQTAARSNLMCEHCRLPEGPGANSACLKACPQDRIYSAANQVLVPPSCATKQLLIVIPINWGRHCRHSLQHRPATLS